MMGVLLLKMSFTGAVLVLVILAVRAILINKLPKQTFLMLWIVAILRLLLPFSISSDFSVYTLVQRYAKTGIVKDAFSENIAAFSKEVPNAAGVENYVPTIQDDIDLKGNITENIGTGAVLNNGSISVWLIVWAAGAGIVALYFVISYIRCYREFRTALPVTNEYAINWMDRSLRRKGGNAFFRRKADVRQSDRISAPLTYGIFRPVILLPKKIDWNNHQELQYVLLHEYTHICRWDALWKLVCVLVVCVHWFNPMAWVLYFFYNRDMELACDERVLRSMGEDRKADYARTLIGMEEKKSALVPIYSGFGKNAIQERIRAIMKIKKVSLGISLFCVALIAAVAVVFATSAQTKAGDEKSPSGEELSVKTEETQTPAESEVLAGADEAKQDLLQEISLEEEYSLKFMVEGIEEEVPADLFVTRDYSILIPKDGWSANAPDCWKSDYNDKVQLWVVHYENRDLVQMTEELAGADYLLDEDSNLFWRKTVDGNLQFQSLRESDTDVWGVIYSYPDQSEFVEGFGARLPVIAASFRLAENSSMGVLAEEEVSTLAKQEVSAEAQSVQSVVEKFADAYFNGDEQGVREYLTDSYEWDVVWRESAEAVSDVKIMGLNDIEKAEVGDTCVISVEYRDSLQNDYLEYLTIELIKQSDGWKIYFYGVQM